MKRPATITDRHLVNMIMEGDRHAASWLIDDTEKLVAHMVYKMVQAADERRDLMQDIYLKVFRGLPQFRFQCKLSTWVAQISYTTCIDYLKKYRPEQVPVPGDGDMLFPAPGSGWEATDAALLLAKRERADILDLYIDSLSPVYRTLIILFHKEEMSIEEIATITGLPEGTVKNYLFRARKALKERLLRHYSKADL